ncbi:linear amide C-N hydrolase [Paraburkholderia fungorum]|jgi:choloylglycine hydrolase|uniref:Linear amide C-N hydrolase n=1 Tax=Paraburkholderia fungorum TaxID=134537 RepID=A0AAP5Q7R3_9BURK|nr:linear amide C-N hydrolase [Paraburkholderia fungorum]MDT8838615.1 linear amide C-N hydrolase [Paraburkholderia fungorum]PRZ49661.1 choloylglycine hydrolase [Paraburkholderia fungorum]
MRRFVWSILPGLFVAATLVAIPIAAPACTRVVYLGDNNDVITARSMDWKLDISTNLYILPRGIARNGEAGPNSLKWTARYGSVVATGYDVSTTDGMNEKGLAAELLWLVESQYPAFDNNSKPGLTIAAWAQYVLDNFATVSEAVAALEKEPFTIVTDNVPGEKRLATLHLAISDATGDSAIVEYIAGKQVIHHGRQYQVMTNSPTFDEQLALNEYWKGIGGTVWLPGTNRSADRFARASFYVNAIPKSEDPAVALASVFSVIRNVSVPFGITTPDEPNISSTRWRTVADHKRLLYFFESALTPNTFWVDLKKVDFSPGAPVKRLDLGKDQRNTFDGEVSKYFQPAPPFRFLGLGGGA